MPLGATVVSEEIGKYFDDKVLYAGLTYGGHAMGCAAAIACINVYKQDNLIERSKEMGKYLGEWHEKVKGKTPVRRRGALHRHVLGAGNCKKSADA